MVNLTQHPSYIQMSVPELYYADGRHVVFSKYTVGEDGIVKNKKNEVIAKKLDNGYHRVALYDDDGARWSVRVARLVLSTFRGKPPTPEHTADHIKSENKTDDRLENLRWASDPQQRENQDRPETLKTAFVIVRGDIEMTMKEWVDHFEGKKEMNPFGRAYTAGMIKMYARRNQHGFAYKKYPNLIGEKWKDIPGSPWQMSNMNRVKFITKHAENVLSGDQLGLMGGYPKIGFTGKTWLCHVLSMMIHKPDEWAAREDDQVVLHDDGGRLNFRPDNLKLGTPPENASQAHDDGAFAGKKSERMKCVSYVGGVFEKEHESQGAAAEYLRDNGYKKASRGRISDVLSGRRKTAYDRTWKVVKNNN